MTQFSMARKCSRTLRKLRFLQGHVWQILAWPMICLAAGALLWGVTFIKLNADKNFLERNTLSQTAALSSAVAKDVSLAMETVDDVTRLIQYQWEHGQTENLHEIVKNSIFLRHWAAIVAVVDRSGNVVKAAQPVDKMPKLKDEKYFLFHRTHPERSLHIEPQTIGRITGLPVIPFSRRLDAADGSFNGIVLLCIKPAYLTSFYDETSFGKQGYLGVRGEHGEFYAETVGGVVVTKPILRTIPSLIDSKGANLIKDPQWSGDDETRFIAWGKLSSYPLFVLVGLSEGEVNAPYRLMATNYMNAATAATFFLFLCALAGTLMTMRLIWRKQQAQEIKDAYRLATEYANEGFYILRALRDDTGYIVDFLFQDCNKTGAAFAGTTPEKLIGVRCSELCNVSNIMLRKDFPKELEICRKAMADGLYEDEFEAATTSSFRGLWLHRRMIRLGDGLAITYRDISAAKAHEQKLLSMAHEDALTKLPNRHWLMNFLPEAIDRARQNQSMLALFFIDIDNFKQVNDTLGHVSGDVLLQIAALRLKSELRPGDSLARLGGDEFTIVLEQVDGAMDAQLVAARIVDTFRQPIELDAGKAMVGTSIGISLFPSDGGDVDTLFRHADIAMYAAKAAGKGRYRFYEAEQYQALMTRMKNEAALRHAVQEDQFILYYQPRLSSQTGEICGIEALVRWQHPTRGTLAPKEFIELAEATGLIIALGALVMDKVCTQIALWTSMHLPMVPVSVNVSASEFNNGDVRNQLALCIGRHHIEPESIEIELTETAIMDENNSVNTLTAIRTTGVKFLVDDFGTGYSSLSQLQRLDTDVLKVDQSFTAELGRNKKAETFFKAIVSMAHALGMGVVAEGVETLQQLRMLQSLDCNELQGYYMCPPVSAEKMGTLMRKRFLMTPAGMLL